MNNFSVHNRFTVVGGGAVSCAHNRVVSVRKMLNTEGGYAKFISLGTGVSEGETLAQPIAQKPCTLVEHNFCPDNGALFAVYEASFTGDDLPPDTEITEVGLGNGSMLCSYATVSAVKKEGVDLCVRAELFLTVSVRFLALVAGENALVRGLLGADKIDLTALTLCSGHNNHFTAVLPMIEEALTPLSTAVTATDEGSVSVTARVNGLAEEIAVCYGGKPVLRGYGIGQNGNHTFTLTVDESRCVRINEPRVSFVYPPQKSDGTAVGEHYTEPIFASVTPSCPQLLRHLLERTATLLPAPSSAYIGVATEKEITVYLASGYTLMPVYKAQRTGEHAMLNADGSLVIAGKRTSLIRLIDGVATATELPLRNVTKIASNSESGGYHVVAVADGRLERIKVGFDGAVQTLDTFDGGDGYEINRHDARYIDFWCNARQTYYSKSLTGENATVVNRLCDYFVYYASNYSVLAVKGRWMVLRRKSDGKQFYGDFGSNTVVEISDGYSRTLSDSFVSVKNGGTLVAVERCYGEASSATAAPLTVPLVGVKQVEAVGDYLLCLFADGRVLTLYGNRAGVSVYCPDAQPSERLSVMAFCIGKPLNYSSVNGTEITITLSVG